MTKPSERVRYSAYATAEVGKDLVSKHALPAGVLPEVWPARKALDMCAAASTMGILCGLNSWKLLMKDSPPI